MDKRFFCFLPCLLAALIPGCGGGGPTSPTDTTTTTTTTTTLASSFRIETLITVYRSDTSGAFWSRGQTESDRIGKILLGVDELETVVGSTNLNNEGGRERLQASIDRFRVQLGDADYTAAFGETKENLERFLNDADGDGWSIDGRSGAGKDWPYDDNGNDPDGWTAQIIVTVTRLR